jgi:hypothetical protein
MNNDKILQGDMKLSALRILSDRFHPLEFLLFTKLNFQLEGLQSTC